MDDDALDRWTRPVEGVTARRTMLLRFVGGGLATVGGWLGGEAAAKRRRKRKKRCKESAFESRQEQVLHMLGREFRVLRQSDQVRWSERTPLRVLAEGDGRVRVRSRSRFARAPASAQPMPSAPANRFVWRWAVHGCGCGEGASSEYAPHAATRRRWGMLRVASSIASLTPENVG